MLSPIPIIDFGPVPADDAGDAILPVDLDKLISTRLLIQGASGAGKSHLLRSFMEGLWGRVPQMVFDLEGEYVTLLDKYDFALFGASTRVAASPANAPLLVRRLLELNASALFDLSDLDTEAERAEFVRRACEELMRLTKSAPRNLILVFDEAQRVCPQSGYGEAISTRAVREICTGGRKRGLCPIFATQRHSAIDATARGMLLNKMVGITPPGIDTNAAKQQLGLAVDMAKRLSELEPGEFLVYGPAVSPRTVLLARGGPVATRHLGPGYMGAYSPPPASEAVQSLYEQIGDMPAEAEQKPEQKATTSGGSVREVVKEVRVEVPVVKEVVVEIPVFRVGEVTELSETAHNLIAMGKDMAAMGHMLLSRLPDSKKPPLSEAAVLKNAPVQPVAPTKPNVDTAGNPVSRPQQAILDTLAELTALGLSQPRREHVAVFAEQSAKSSAFTNNLSALRTAGLINYPASGCVTLTQTGNRKAAIARKNLTQSDLHDQWLVRLPMPQQRILRYLILCYPDARTRDTVAHQVAASATSSAYTNNLGVLRSLGLIDYPAKGEVSATPLLFPEGFPE